MPGDVRQALAHNGHDVGAQVSGHGRQGPGRVQPGRKPSVPRAPITSWSTSPRRPPGPVLSCRRKMALRTSLIVPSRSSTTSSSRSRTSGLTASRAADCTVRPTANRRWMTRSCRSRAMRSRSSRTASLDLSRCAAATSTARATWSPKAPASARSSGAAATPPACQPRTRTPRHRGSRPERDDDCGAGHEGGEPVHLGRSGALPTASTAARTTGPSSESSPAHPPRGSHRELVGVTRFGTPAGHPQQHGDVGTRRVARRPDDRGRGRRPRRRHR